MNVKKLKKVQEKHKKIIAVIDSYAFLAREWDIASEDDFESFSDAIMDALLKGE